MKTVALISGGKDSCFNMMHCVANGHEIIALGNLYPTTQDELDSFMFQTVGHEVIGYYSECLQVPLYRHAIRGSSIDTSETYSITNQDEVEDLFELLQKVKKEHPDLEAVSTGAILSSYQRVRVEHVCSRLGLTSLAYLWQMDQSTLLSSMIQFGMNAVLIKVAAIGLTQKHLGKSLSELQSHLESLKLKYGINVCGEGGEYETLTLSCPLFKKRIEFVETEIIIHSDDMFAPVAFLKVKKAVLVDNPDYNLLWVERLRTQAIIPFVEYNDWSWVTIETTLNTAVYEKTPKVTISDQDSFYCVSLSSIQKPSLQETAKATLESIKTTLESVGLSLAHAVLMTVFVKDMSDFGQLNAIYKTFFWSNPSPRVTVQVNMKQDLMIECIAFKSLDITRKQNLHVQGISYWAPANIGPYSQACIVDDVIFMAGMIGLDPSSMQLKQGSTEQETFEFQALQAIQSSKEVSNVLAADLFKDTFLCVCFVTKELFVSNVKRLVSKLLTDTAVITVVVPRLPRDALVEFQFILASKKGYMDYLRRLDPHSEIPSTEKEIQYLEKNNFKLISHGLSAFLHLEITCQDINVIIDDIHSSILAATKNHKLVQIKIYSLPEMASELHEIVSTMFSVAVSVIPTQTSTLYLSVFFRKPYNTSI